ncbi:MAG: uroporphyrinogen decarboxylase [Acetobacteraceae bacterium]
MIAGKRLLRVLEGEAVWPPPVWLMRQAGRYLPEYRRLRAEAADFLSFCLTPELAVEATLQPARRFGLDAAILFSDILVLPWALGHTVSFEEGIGPVVCPLRDEEALARLDLARLAEAIEPVEETIRGVRAALAGEVALIGFAGGPFTLACYLVDGRGGEFAYTRRMVREQPALFERLIERLTDAVIPYLVAEAEAGCEVLMLFDSWAGLLPPPLFQRFVIGPAARIAAAVKARLPGVKLIGFPRLAGVMIEGYARRSGVDAVSLDTSFDPRLARTMIPAGIGVQGNLDPFALLAGGAGLRREAQEIARAFKGRLHIFNLGHGVLPQTPPEHVGELVDTLRHCD